MAVMLMAAIFYAQVRLGRAFVNNSLDVKIS